MAKRPKDTPEVGDRVQWRGHPNCGTLRQVDTSNDWSQVDWDHGGPVIIHLFELRKLPN